jgi:hypothetical protein
MNATSHWVLTPKIALWSFESPSRLHLPKVGVALGVWRFTPSYFLTFFYTPGSMWCDSQASSWPAPLRPLCLDSWLPFGSQLCNPFALVVSPKLGLRQVCYFIYASIYMRFCVWILFKIYYRVWIYDMLKLKEHICKKIVRKNLTKKKLWTFEWPKMNNIFISPYHNHVWVDFNFYFLNMYIK